MATRAAIAAFPLLPALEGAAQGKTLPAAVVKRKIDATRNANLRPMPEAVRTFCIQVLMRHSQSQAAAGKNCAPPRNSAELLIAIQPGVERLLESVLTK